MGNGYTRQSSAEIVDTNDIEASHFNDEFNALQSAFDSSSGHSHNGTSGEGPLIDLTTSITGILPVARGGIAAKHKIDGTTAPTTTDDSGSGYGPGSIWVDVTNDKAYVCVDATSSTAVWYQISSTSYIAAIGALTPTDGSIIVGDGSTWVAESGATARTSLGVGTGDSPQFTGIELGHASDTTLARVSSGVISIEGDTVLMATADIGTTVQAYNAALDDISGLAVTDGNIIVGNGTNWVAESGSTARASLGLVIGTDVQAYDAELAALAGLTSAANKLPMFSGSGTATLLDFKDEDNMASNSATAVPSQQSVKAYVDSQVGAVGFALDDISDVTITTIASGELLKWNGSAWINQTIAEVDAELGALAGLTSAADKLPYFTGSGTASLADFSSYGRTLVDDADAATARTTLGLELAATYDVSTATEFRNDTSAKVLTGEIVWDAAEPVTLTSSSNSVAFNLDSGINFIINTLGENTTLANATGSFRPGQSGFIRVIQDGTGSRTMAFDTDYVFANGNAPVLTTTASAEDVLFYTVLTTDKVLVASVLDIS